MGCSTAFECRGPLGHCFYDMKQLGVFLLPLDEMLVHHRVTRSIKFALYPFVHLGGESLKVKCLALEDNTPSVLPGQVHVRE